MKEIIATIGGIFASVLFLCSGVLYVCWLFGIRFTKKSQDEYNKKKKVYRKYMNDSWKEHREKNTFIYARRTNYVQNGYIESYDSIHSTDPGLRIKNHIYVGAFLVIGSLAFTWFTQYISNSYVAGILAIGGLAYFLYLRYEMLIYENILHKIFYTSFLLAYIIGVVSILI